MTSTLQWVAGAARCAVMLCFLGYAPCACSASEEPVRVATAANFSSTLSKITALFFDRTKIRVEPSAASTGQLAAQIQAGAPFDIFLAADTRRPQQLIDSGYAIAGSRFVYARGTLVLWSRDPEKVNAGDEVLRRKDLGVVAIADPRTAPYGAAAQEFLQSHGLWLSLTASGHISTAASVTQAYQYAASGSAALGFVALSQVLSGQRKGHNGSHWRVPTEPGALDQEAVLLKRAKSNQPARDFIDFLRNDPGARQLIQQDGYTLP